MAFDHEKMEVYRLAIRFVARASEIIELLPRGRGYFADQLQRAALSIVLNIAEGAGKYSPACREVRGFDVDGRRPKALTIEDV